MKLLRDNDIMISCKHCKLILEVIIDMEIEDLSLKCSNRGSHTQSHTLDIYRSAVRKLINDMVDSFGIASWKQENNSESFSKCHIEDTKNMVIKNIKSHPWENDGKLLACNICFFLNNSSQNVRKPISARETGLLLRIECGELHIQSEIKKKLINKSKDLLKVDSYNIEFKPRRISRIRTSHYKHANISTENENYSSVPNFAPDADLFSHKKSQIQENYASSFDSGCSNEGICPSIECLRCLYIKLLKEENMQNIMYLKWQCQQRRLLLRALLKIAKSFEASGAKLKLHEVHGVFWQCIFVLFDGKPCFDTNSTGYDLSLFELMGDNNIGDIFSIERGALLYTLSWFFLKVIHTVDRSTKCSLSNVEMQDIISWLLRAFILCRDIPTLFQKVSQLLATLILLSTVDSSIPLPFCSQQSLSISHWAAYFHQASIGSVLNHQYLSAVKDKASIFMANKKNGR